jgi:hypothetical protein
MIRKTGSRLLRIALFSLALTTFASAFTVAFASVASADVAAQFAVLNVRAPNDPNVNGLRLSVLQGKADKVRGVDFGLLSLSSKGNFSGAGFIMGICHVTGDMDGGVTFALIAKHEGNDTGLNASFINLTNNVKKGMNFGFVNVAQGHTMIDFGGFNGSESSTVQIGFINMTRRIDAVQIGFINMAENGFFPIFPIVNFPAQE